ncbi:MAG: hypothetical protein QXH07_06555 [Thermoplasmata archaeon]
MTSGEVNNLGIPFVKAMPCDTFLPSIIICLSHRPASLHDVPMPMMGLLNHSRKVP